ncbi:MAG: ChaN family lipoprotein [Planctomycetota bacterium]
MHSFRSFATRTNEPCREIYRERRRATALALLAAASACTPSKFHWPNTPKGRLSAYRQSYFDAVGTRIVATVERADAIAEIRRSGAVWLGDHHRHSLLHGLQLELLGALSRSGAPIALGLEAIGEQDIEHVRAFLARKIDMRQLRRRMLRRWPGSWLDDRELDPSFFQSLLALARERRLSVFALEPTPRLPLAERDDRIATSIAAARDQHPEHLLVVVVGQAHLLGQGDVIRRSGVGGVAIGGLPPEALAAPTNSPPRGTLVKSDGGVLWFAEMF